MDFFLHCYKCNRQFISTIFFILCLFCIANNAIHPGCRCYLFQSSATKKYGVFKSPSYPDPYPIHLPCLLYVFVADQEEIVHLKMEQFKLKPRITANNNVARPFIDHKNTTRCDDYVRLFLDSPRAELSAEDKFNYELCGDDPKQRDFYSSGRVLMLEFHAQVTRFHQPFDAVNPFTGFKGEFFFRKTAQYKVDGQLIVNSVCDYSFNSDATLKAGQFFSPRHPQNYHPSTTCNYYFRGLSSERIRLDFTDVDLGSRETNNSACLRVNYQQSDAIIVYDQEGSKGNILGRFVTACPFYPNTQVVSPENYLKVTFKSNSDLITGFGFKAIFSFVERHKLQPTKPIEDSSYREIEDPHSAIFKHTVTLNMRDLIAGSFSSVNFPNRYPKSTEITYNFIGEPGQIIRIKFVDFQLDKGVSNCNFDYQGDRLILYDGFSPEYSSMARVMCGSGLQADFWSKGHYLTFVFHSDDKVTPEERGFNANYYFIYSDLNNNPSSNVPKNDFEVVEPPGCSSEVVTIKSNSGAKGTVITAGYPFSFDKSQCIWFLEGTRNSTERVVLSILDLDIDSSVNCSSPNHVLVTKYIELQDLQEDPVPLKYCQVRPSQPVRIMSTNVPKLQIRLSTQKISKPTIRGLQFSYSFVQDFGVKGSHKVQDPSQGCHFNFYSQQSQNGSFTSPNYPDLYPEKVTCTYQFHAKPYETIRIEFATFKTESPTTNNNFCRVDDSDFVYVEDCFSNRVLWQRFCGIPLPNTRYAITLQTQCIKVKFVSNDRYVNTGFLAYYFFEKYSNTIHSRLGDDGGKPGAAPTSCANLCCLMMFLAYIIPLVPLSRVTNLWS